MASRALRGPTHAELAASAGVGSPPPAAAAAAAAAGAGAAAAAAGAPAAAWPRESQSRLELGWISGTSILPSRARAIEGVSVGSFLGLQAELYRAQEQARLFGRTP